MAIGGFVWEFISVTDEAEQFIEQIRNVYRDLVAGAESKIVRGRHLWHGFEIAAEAFIRDPVANERPLTERVNELVLAKVLSDDQSITGTIEYEPDILDDGRKIDFVVTRDDDALYIECKTVHPRTEDNEQAWNNYLRRRQYHPEGVNFVVEREWMGGACYGNTFASRSHFLEYTLEFEHRLVSAREKSPGPGIMVFCGNGFAWNVADLEDFADYYHAGIHRADDPFALMEQHHINSEGLVLLRNVDHFAFIQRPVELPDLTELNFPIRGPRFGGVLVQQ